MFLVSNSKIHRIASFFKWILLDDTASNRGIFRTFPVSCFCEDGLVSELIKSNIPLNTCRIWKKMPKALQGASYAS